MGRNEGKNEKCISQSLHNLFIKKINENHNNNKLKVGPGLLDPVCG